MSKPTLVFVPGAWHVPAHYNALYRYLESRGYKCVSNPHPSTHRVDGTFPENPLQADIAVVRSTLLSELEHNDIVLVPHSYGGIPGMSACKGLDTKTRLSTHHKTSVVAVAFIAAFMIPEGRSLYQSLEGTPPDFIEVEGDAIKVAGNSIDWLYQDCPTDLSESAKSMMVEQSLHAFLGPCQYSSYKDIPTHYLSCKQDRPIPMLVQKRFIDSAREDGGNIAVKLMDAGHSPFLSKTEDTGNYVRMAAGEKDIVSNLQAC